MAIKPFPNQIAFSDIENEFGVNSQRSLGKYRITEVYDSLALSLDFGIQGKSGDTDTISFGQFHDKRLNLLVDFYSGNPENQVTARTRYDDTSTAIIGKASGIQIAKPASTGGKRIRVYINKVIYGGPTNASRVASQSLDRVSFKTGEWDLNTDIHIAIGTNGGVYGTGGTGGDPGGGDVCDTGGPGGHGQSCMGLQHQGVKVRNYGVLIHGYGGGGAGGGAYKVAKHADRASSGGGGGGGAGNPVGAGGPGGRGAFGSGSNGDPGSAASTPYAGGAGGSGGGGDPDGGDGGDGGDPSGAAQKGDKGTNGNKCRASGGAAGAAGAHFVRAQGSYSVTFNPSRPKDQFWDGSTAVDGTYVDQVDTLEQRDGTPTF